MVHTELIQAVLSLGKSIDKLSQDVGDLTNQLNHQGGNTQTQNLESRVELLATNLQRVQLVTGINPITEPDTITHADALKLFWHCSPRQHAILQMLLNHQTSLDIAKRIGTTEGGARSQVRYLISKLSLTSRRAVIHNFKEIFFDADPEEYLAKTKIQKEWFDLYGGLSYDQAEKLDSHFITICKTNYRMPK